MCLRHEKRFKIKRNLFEAMSIQTTIQLQTTMSYQLDNCDLISDYTSAQRIVAPTCNSFNKHDILVTDDDFVDPAVLLLFLNVEKKYQRYTSNLRLTERSQENVEMYAIRAVPREILLGAYIWTRYGAARERNSESGVFLLDARGENLEMETTASRLAAPIVHKSGVLRTVPEMTST